MKYAERYHKGGLTMSDTIKKCTFYFPLELYERLRLEAFQTRESQNSIVLEALTKYFEQKDKPGE